MNAEEYEIESEKFTQANREFNRAKHAFEKITKPTESEVAAFDAAELKFMRAEKAKTKAYATHSAASPDTSEQKIVGDKRVPLTAGEIAARDAAQKQAEESYWPAMKENV
ncbi:MAG: hypothetical protein WC736_15015 [Gallionella sp.]|jgi:hypothetical protein